MHSRESISLALVMLFTLVGIFALLKTIQPEFYVFAMAGMSLVTIFSLMKKKIKIFLYTVFIVYELICLSWALASNFQTLPRYDIYHYYPFTRYIYETGHFNYPDAKTLEKIFFGTIVPWPLWHIVQVCLSQVTRLDLFYTTQIVQALTTVPLTILVTTVLAKNMGKFVLRDRHSSARINKGYLNIMYLVTILISFSSFFVYSNTNPVSRSFAGTLYLLLFYLLVKALYEAHVLLNCTILFLIILSIVFAHPYWSLATPLVLITTCVILYVLSKVVKVSEAIYLDMARSALVIGLSSFMASIVWITYYTYAAKTSLADALRKLILMGGQDVLGINVVKPWLETTNVQYAFFKVHPLEHLVYWLVWATDLVIIALAVPNILVIVLSTVKKRLSKVNAILMSILVASTTILLMTGISSSGLVTRYAIKLVYVPAGVIAVLSLSKLTNALKTRSFKLAKFLLAIIVVLYIMTASLSLGVRTYQASFIWSSMITFEDKGMPSTHAIPLMNFCNKYCNYYAYDYILTDDLTTRVFMPLNVFIEFTERGGKMAPQKFTWILYKNVHKALILSVKNFKPSYWSLKLPTKLHMLADAKIEIKKYSSMVFDNGVGKIYIYVRS